MLLSAFESSAQENDKFICLSSRQKQKRRKKSLPDLPSKLKDKKKNRGSRIHPVENLAG